MSARPLRPRAAILLILLTGLAGDAQAQKPTLDDISDSFGSLAERVNPAIVQIFSMSYAAAQGIASGELITEQSSRGSGVLLSEDGYIVTNAHVVTGASRVRVSIPQQEERRSVLGSRGRVLGAQVVGFDLETDLAVLKTNGTALPHLSLGDSESLRPGELVFAFGSPLGLENSVTMGVVSSVARQLRDDDPMIYIQTDASINPGNSGGALVDASGQVMGINTMIFSQSGGNEGLGFAVPANIVRNVFEQIRSTGRVARGEIGVTAQTITPLLAKGLELPRDWGVIVSDIEPGGPAEASGVDYGDIVLSLDDKPMENARQLAVNLYQKRVGDRVRLGLLRNGETVTAVVEVVERPDHPYRFSGLVNPDRNLVPELDILGIDLEPKLAGMFTGLRVPNGVIVAARAASSNPVAGEGLLPGDVIHQVNRLSVKGLGELKAALARYRRGDAVVLLVEREGELRYVTLEMY